eukprot:CAMPEP_0198140306 /NCGR_PEP_ID=MMETSP1443-20131203/3484_1 /TAXON_ID=186043 /ORGANISM="Entomoneis sp., Strain CCMP2396" /LENGTH=423 /DNA_ID=CAMNT_0043802679 /DNA_START=40 /DNA_END=1311 /DNA_ORIENTATION=+
MPRLENPDAFRRANPETLVAKVAEVVAEESNKSFFFDEDSLNVLPRFERSELITPKVVGRGGFGVVREIQSIQLKELAGEEDSSAKSKQRNFFGGRDSASIGSFSSKNARSLATLEADLSSREQLARQVWKRKGGKYVVKEIEKEFFHTNRVTFLKGMIDLAMEAKFLATLNHPHIISFRGLSIKEPTEDMSYFLVLDHLEEILPKRLNAWMQQKRASQGITGALTGGRKRSKHLLTDRILVAYDVAGVMAYLHSRGIIYRDLKPDNIGFTADADLKVFDFGLAKELHEVDVLEGGLYNLTGLTGAIRYMAPENGLRKPYNFKADVYSWSMLMWNIMALEPPLGMYTPNMFLDRVFAKNYRPAINEKWPADISNIIRDSWDPEIDRRPSFQDIMDRLKIVASELDPEISSFMGSSMRSLGSRN